jgi:hypothetical protein
LPVITCGRGSAAICLIWELQLWKTLWQLEEVFSSPLWRHLARANPRSERFSSAVRRFSSIRNAPGGFDSSAAPAGSIVVTNVVKPTAAQRCTRAVSSRGRPQTCSMTSRWPNHPDQDKAERVPFRMAAAVLIANSRAPGRGALPTTKTKRGDGSNSGAASDAAGGCSSDDQHSCCPGFGPGTENAFD